MDLMKTAFKQFVVLLSKLKEKKPCTELVVVL